MSLATTIGMGLVLLMGALVTKTESGRGCGDDWPLCNGKFIPAYTIESMIEYSHRAVSGLVGLLVLAAAIYTWVLARRHKEALLFAFSALFFTVLQAILGAMAVMQPQSDAVLAFHFGFSLVAFSATLLLAIGVWRGDFLTQASAKDMGAGTATAARVSRKFRNTVWIVAAYSYIVVYVGAFVRHTDSSGGCIGWPLCNGQVVPELDGATGIAFLHRVAAAILFLAIAYIAYRAGKTYQHVAVIRRSSRWALLLAGSQVISGALIVYTLGTDWYLFAALLHVVLIACLFGILCDMCVRVRRMAA
ncbi:COX15/CtaA family protein [Paenibacillus koleovorans]|uniref:COX15/CtaA family protein n=1 Tax=Paenibacillus koleovorans TaxID=121608 RepID=UPI0027D7B41B|nr:COX15/CtaA family protein [Paenibacillus koleovorans]